MPEMHETKVVVINLKKIGRKTSRNINSKSVTKDVANANKKHLPQRNVLLK